MITSEPSLTAAEGVGWLYAAMAVDPDGDPLDWSLPVAPAGMSVTPSTGLVSWTPGDADVGTHAVVLRVDDPEGAWFEQAFDLDVAEGAQAPTITSEPSVLWADPSTTWSYAATAEDPDDSSLTWSIAGPAGASVDSTGLVTWAVPGDAAGSYSMTLTVADPGGLQDEQDFTVGVVDPGDVTPPTASITSPADGDVLTSLTAVVGTADDATFAGYDLELCRDWGPADCLTVDSGVAPVVDDELGTLVAPLFAAGTWELVLTVTDASGNQAEDAIDVTIDAAGNAGITSLAFDDMTVWAGDTGLTLTRIYDGTDLGLHELGHGWRFRWSIGHSEAPEPLDLGWEVVYQSGFPPSWEVVSTADHPVEFVLADGRAYQFEAFFDMVTPSGSSQFAMVAPAFVEVGGTGATAVPLNAMGQEYTALDFAYGQIYELDTFNPWSPTYFLLDTGWNEQLLYDANTGEIVEETFPDGGVLDLSGDPVTYDGVPILDLQYGADGLVTAAVDPITGTQVTYTRDGADDLVQVIDAVGGEHTYTYDADHVMLEFTAPTSGSTVVQYDDQGREVLTVDGDGVPMQTVYDDDAGTVTKIDAGGNAVVMEVDSLGRVTSSTDPLGNTTTWTFDGDLTQPATMTDPLGHTWTYGYDDQGRRVSTADPLGGVATITFDPASGELASFTDEEGRTWTEMADAVGRPTAQVLPDGTTVATFDYPSDDTVVQTDAFGNTTTRVLDGRGREVSRTDPLGAVITTSYDDALLSGSVAWPDGSSADFGYDPAGRFTSIDAGWDTPMTYSYQGAGQLPQEVVRPDGVLQEWVRTPGGRLSALVVDGQAVSTRSYDALGRLASEAGPDGSKAYSYDAAGRRVEVVHDADVEHFAYDAAGRMSRYWTDSGTDVTLEYDAAGRIVAREWANGQRLDYTYDASGRPLTVTAADGRAWQVTWDANGRPASLTHPGGLQQAWTWVASADLEDERFASETRIDGATWSYDYDAGGDLVGVTGPDSGTTTYERDPEGTVTAIVDALGRDWSFVLDQGELVERVSPAGRAQSFELDGAGRRASWTREDSSEVTYGYGPGLATTTLPSGEVHTFQVLADGAAMLAAGGSGGDAWDWKDAQGRPSFVELDDGGTVELEYDATGRALSYLATTPAGDQFEVSYGYDEAGNLVELTDPDGGVTIWSYDPGGRPATVDRPNGTSTSYTWTDYGRPLSIQHHAGASLLSEYLYTYDGHGRVVTASTPEGYFEYEYDGASRLTVQRQRESAGGAVIEEILNEWDLVGNLVQRTDTAGTTVFSHDVDDRLVQADGPDGSTTWSWSDRGALLSSAGPGGTTTYTWDDLDRLTSVTLPDGATVDYLYDARGRLLSRTDGDGERRCLPLPTTPLGWDDCAVTYGPGGADPEGRVFGPRGLASTHGAGTSRFALDALQRTTVGLVDGAGTQVGAAAFDPWGALTSSSGERPDHGFTGERQDPATGLVYLRARWYDPSSGRLLTPDDFGAASEDPRTLHRYLYAMGDPLNRTDPSGRFTLVEINVTTGIQAVLRGIQGTIRFCLKQIARKRAFKAWGTAWVQGSIKVAMRSLLSSVWSQLSTGGALPFASEARFAVHLARAFCGGGDDNPAMSAWEFEVFVTSPCGLRRPRPHSPSGAFFQCVQNIASVLTSVSGIDVVYGQIIPIELKMSRKPGDDQLTRYCRFAANYGAHAAVFAYVRAPTRDTQLTLAKKCWGCWGNEAGADPSGCDGAKTPAIGSIYIGFGAVAAQGRHVYVAVPTCTGF